MPISSPQGWKCDSKWRPKSGVIDKCQISCRLDPPNRPPPSWGKPLIDRCIIHQSIPPVPSTPTGLLWGICPPSQSWGWGICKFCTVQGPGICQPWGHSRAFDTHMISYQNITTQKVLPEKKADWLICQGQE